MQAKVVILIFTHKAELEWHEQIALRQCFQILGRHPIRLVCPRGLDLTAYQRIAPGLKADYVPADRLMSLRAYNRLKVLPWLYRRYSAYEYILTYELDAFVFRDELLEWCSKGWDYIGAPWFKGYDLAKPDAEPQGVGNSGFSLRRTAAMLRVLSTWRYQQPPYEIWRGWREGRISAKTAFAALTVRNNFFGCLNNFNGQEDFFWCQVAAGRFPWFRLAPFDEARKFSFESNPSRLYQEGGGLLPFGCHKWMHREPEFWREHIPCERFDVLPTVNQSTK